MNASTIKQQDPFAPIERVLISDPGQEQKRYSVRQEDASAEKGWREVGISPPGHLFVSNEELYCMADEIARLSLFDWEGAELFFDGLRFAYALYTTDVFEDIGGREALCAGLLTYTSYDGSWDTGCQLFAYRPVSTSGLLHDQHFGDLEVERAWEYLEEAEEKLGQFAERARMLKQVECSAQVLAKLRRGPLSSWPTSLWGEFLDRFLNGTDHSAWDLLTRSTAFFWNRQEGALSRTDFCRNKVLTEVLIGTVKGAAAR